MSASVGAIETCRPLHAELLYGVLAHLDLGRDAASLYDPRRPRRAWAEGLKEAYLAAPGRLVVQILPLLVRDEAVILQVLHDRRLPGLVDEPGRRLCDRLATALEAELPVVRKRWEATSTAAWESTERLLAWMRPLLERLRATLYRDSAPPPLLVVDCDALRAGTGGGTRGRGVSHGGRRLVALSLAVEREQVLCQLLHEEIHAVTDEPIRKRFGAVDQDTRLGGAGFELHRELERAAVERGQRLLEQEAPELLGAYGAWRRRHGV